MEATTPTTYTPATNTTLATNQGQQIREFIERIEKLEAEKADITNCTREIYSEAKGSGLEPKIIRQLIRLRKMDQEDITKEEDLLNQYKKVLGMKQPKE